MLTQDHLQYEGTDLPQLTNQFSNVDLEENAEPAPDPNVFTDVIKAPFRGIGNAAKSTAELAYDFTDYITGGKILNDWDPELYKSKTIAGGLVQGVSNFLTGFIPVFGWLGKAKTLANVGKIGKGAIAGAITDFTVFDAQEGNLSSLIQSYPQLANPVTELLSTSEDDSEASGRLKNVLEGAGLGAMTEGLIGGIRGIRRARAAKLEGDAVATNKALVSELSSPEDIRSSTAIETKLSPEQRELAADMKVRLPDYVKGGRPNLKALNSPEEVAPLLELTTQQRYEKGIRVSVEDMRTQGLEEVSKETMGMDVDELVEYLNATMHDLDKATLKASGLIDMVKEQSLRTTEAAQKALSGSMFDEAQFMKEFELMSPLANIHVASGRMLSRGLGARRGLDREFLKSREAVREYLDNIGSDKFRSTELEKYAQMSPNQLAKAAAQNQTLGGRLLRAHNEYWINSILSGPQTFMVNAMSNAFTSFFLPAERALGGLFTGQKGVIRSSLKQYAFAYHSAQESLRMAFKSLKTDSPVLRGPYSGGLSRSDTISSNRISSSELGIGSNSAGGKITDFLGKLVNMPTRMLMSTDEFFQQINYRSAAKMKLYQGGLDNGLSHREAAEAAEQQFQNLLTQSGEIYTEAAVHRAAIADAKSKGLSGLKGVKHIENYISKNWDPNNSALAEFADIAEYAKDQAAEATFTRELEPGTIGHSIQQFLKKHPMTQLAVPFVRTPVNLLKFVGQRTFPLVSFGKNMHTPALMKIHKRAIADIASGDALRVAEARGRMATGSAIMATASTLALNGQITGGGPNSEQERKILQETGWRPYSLKVGDQYISYQRFDPFSTLFGVIADYSYVANRQDDITQGTLQTLQSAIIVSLTQNVTNKSYLAGIAKVVEVLNQPERFGASTARKHVASYIPNLLGQAVVGLGQDEAMREVRTLSDALLGRIPGATYALEPRRNILGGVVERQLHTTPWLSNVEDWVNPAVLSHDKKDKVWQELADLQHGFTQPPPVLQGRINMLEYKNTAGQSSYDRWMELIGTTTIGGKTVHDALLAQVNSKSYRRLASKGDLATAGIDGVSTDRIGRINKILTRYRKVALRKTYKEFSDLNSEVQNTLKLKRAVRSGEASQQLQALINN